MTIYGQQSLLSLSGHIRVGFLTVHHLAQKDTALPLDVHARAHAQWIYKLWAPGRGYNHLISNKREWNNCFIKNAQKILRILPDCICKNNRFSTCTVYTIFGEHGNGSCTMMAKPIRALEFDSQKYSNDSTSLLNSHQNRFPLDFSHRFNVILPSVTRSPFRSVHDRPCLLLGG